MRVLLLGTGDDGALAGGLRRAGMACECCVDAPDALLRFDPCRHDAVVIDLERADDPAEDHGAALIQTLRERGPRTPLVAISGPGNVADAVRAIRLGASDCLSRPFATDLLVAALRGQPPAAGEGRPPQVVSDPRMLALYGVAERAARRDVTILLQGESGTGKEMLARHIHAASARASGPFVAINCAAIPEQMLEAMMFGHEKGAFTGALNSAPGKFEQAAGGTLLLDEISEMALPLQAKLLRVLQEQEVERVGGRTVIALDARIIATTNRDLAACVRAGTFREDLYYRLSVLPLCIPPLRERLGEVLPLAGHLLARHCPAGMTARFSPAAAAALLAHDWPGNVRELENAVQRALVYSLDGEIGPDDLQLPARPLAADGGARGAPDLGASVREAELALILRTLDAHAGSRRDTASALGVSERTLRYKLARMRERGIDPDHRVPAPPAPRPYTALAGLRG